MNVIDDQGRLFGLINVIDALVIFVVVAVVVAGLVFVFTAGPDTSPDTTTRYVTLDLGTQPAYVSTLVTESDVVESSERGNLTITDVYVTDSSDGRHLYVRAMISAETNNQNNLLYDGGPLRVGRELSLETDEYETSGTITDIDSSGSDLPISNTDVLLRTTTGIDLIQSLKENTVYRVDGHTVATIRSVTAYRTANPEQVQAYIGITYRTYQTNDGPQFAGQTVRRGATLPFESNAYPFEGTVLRVGSLSQRGRVSTRTVQLEMENVDPDLASSLHEGLTEGVGDDIIAEVTAVEVEPATVVLTSQDGNVYRREHPVNKDVTITAEIRVREAWAGPRFKADEIQQGRTIVLNFGTVAIEAEVVTVR